ncbi:MAG: ABC transporter ATP-binding protein [Idiomarina sp.]|nr:ABC transporter ATP-binding protein [Idiomarina sp.]
MSGLDLTDVVGGYGQRQVLRGVSGSFPIGRVTGLLGVNGSGKSTLLKLVAGIEPVTRGQIGWQGSELALMPRAERARLIGYLGQRETPAWGLPAGDLVALGALYRSSAEAATAMQWAMKQTDVLSLATRSVHELSTGELQRVLLARVLAGQPKLLLVDEPTAGLDPLHQQQAMAILRNQAAQGACVIVVLHDLQAASDWCDDIALLHEGTIYAHGPTPTTLTPQNQNHVFQTQIGVRPL